MLVAVLIGIMISIVVGVTLVPTVIASTMAARGDWWDTTTGSVSPADTTTGWESGAPTGLFSLIDVLPYIFVAVILLGAVAWIGGQG